MSAVITCLIVEDEPLAMQLMEDYIRKLPLLHLKGKCYDALDAIEFLKNNTADVIFLDINMPALSGLEMAALIPKNQRIIFTTAYAEYALDSFSFHVIDYLLKPVSFKRFLQAIQKLQLHLLPSKTVEPPVKEPDLLFIKTGRTVIHIAYADILFIESNREYLQIHTKHQKHMIYKRMKDMAAALPPSFIRIHHSFIINLTYLQKTGTDYVQIDERVLPISSTYKAAFQKKMNEHIL